MTPLARLTRPAHNQYLALGAAAGPGAACLQPRDGLPPKPPCSAVASPSHAAVVSVVSAGADLAARAAAICASYVHLCSGFHAGRPSREVRAWPSLPRSLVRGGVPLARRRGIRGTRHLPIRDGKHLPLLLRPSRQCDTCRRRLRPAETKH